MGLHNMKYKVIFIKRMEMNQAKSQIVLTERIKRQILDAIYSNDMPGLRQMMKQGYDLNYKMEYDPIEIDQYVTPLITASYLGRIEAVNLMINNKLVDINLASEPNCKLVIHYSFHSFNGCLSQW